MIKVIRNVEIRSRIRPGETDTLNFLVDTEQIIRPGSWYVLKYNVSDTMFFVNSTNLHRGPVDLNGDTRYTVIMSFK